MALLTDKINFLSQTSTSTGRIHANSAGTQHFHNVHLRHHLQLYHSKGYWSTCSIIPTYVRIKCICIKHRPIVLQTLRAHKTPTFASQVKLMTLMVSAHLESTKAVYSWSKLHFHWWCYKCLKNKASWFCRLVSRSSQQSLTIMGYKFHTYARSSLLLTPLPRPKKVYCNLEILWEQIAPSNCPRNKQIVSTSLLC
jgi:hypothetical protein